MKLKKFDLYNIKGKQFRNNVFYKVLNTFFVCIVTFIANRHVTEEVGLPGGKMIFFNIDQFISLVIKLAIIYTVIALFGYANKKNFDVVSVVNSEGIYTEERLIPWEDIKAIEYKTPIFIIFNNPLKMYSHLLIYTDTKAYAILHAPHSLACYIKKEKKDVLYRKRYTFIFKVLVIVTISIISPYIEAHTRFLFWDFNVRIK